MSTSSSVPKEVSRSLDLFFSEPLKRDRQGTAHDIRRSSLQYKEALALAGLICQLRPEHSLEIGLAEGGSCIAITAARRYCSINSRHIVLDPFQETLSFGTGLLELERLGLRDNIIWHEQYSECYLLDRLKHNEPPFDFAFVDGGHNIGQKVTDAFLLNKVVRPGGVIAFHDALLMSTSIAVRYLVTECGYETIELSCQQTAARLLRQIRHSIRLGPWYVTKFLRHACRSLIALRKPNDAKV